MDQTAAGQAGGMKHSSRSLMVAGMVAALLAACGSSATTDPAVVPAATDPVVATTVDAVGASGPATTVDAVVPVSEAPIVTEAPVVTEVAPVVTEAAASAAVKVSANDASPEEIAAALEAAGVTNAPRWAREIAEYRPYPKDDPTFAKLRDELAKYNPADGVVDLIVATLVP